MRVVQFIMSHLDGDLSVAALARRFSLKDRVLLTAFESHTGIALGQFVLRRRLERALDFLKNATASDSEIAMGLGWGSASAFRTAVVNYLGVSPTEYRTSLPLNKQRLVWGDGNARASLSAYVEKNPLARRFQHL